MDRSFEGLLISVIVHILLVVLYFNAPSMPSSADSDKTEITILDQAPVKPTKSKSIVTETDKEKPPMDLNEAAEFLSQFTKRVKKQIIARNNGDTRNSQPSQIPLKAQPTSERKKVAGLDTDRRGVEEEGVGLAPPGGNQAMRQVAIGPSSISEYIPGVEVGEFTALNTDQFTYYSFFDRINGQVRNRWVSAVRNYTDGLSQKDIQKLSQYDRQTVVEIILKPNGEYSSKVIGHSSGDARLDQTTIDAFQAAAPFLNPPRGLIESDGFIHLRYGFVVRFRPPFGQATN